MNELTRLYTRSRILPLLAGLAILAGPAVAGAGEPVPEVVSRTANGVAGPISLVEAQRMAFERNWDLLAASVGVEAATAQKIVAREFPNPTVSLASSKVNLDHHPNSTYAGNGLWDRSYDTVAAISQLVEIGGKRGSRQRSAQAGYEAAKAQLLDARRALDLGVARAYVAALQAQETVGVLRESANSLREEARLAGVRLAAGEISVMDRDQIEISALRFEQDARTAGAVAAQDRIALEVLLGLAHPRGAISLADRLDALVAGAALPATNTTGFRRPDVLAAEAAWRKAEADWRLQKALRVPDPSFQVQYEHNPPDSPSSAGLGVSFPLPLWNRNRGAILAAQAAKDQAELAFEKSRAQAVADISTAWLAYQDAVRRWAEYRDNIRPKSEQIRKTKAYAYQRGGASLLDMLVAERDDNEVRLAALQATSDAATALAALRAAALEVQPTELKK